MMVITDKHMQAAATGADQWLIEAGPRGAGRFVGRITPTGERLFYLRYSDPAGSRVRLPIGSYDPKGRSGLKLAEARAIANEWSRLYQSGVRDLRQHFADLQAADLAGRQAELTNAETAKREADEAAVLAELEQQRRLTIRQLFDRWAQTELTPHIRADGKRTGRKDSGLYTKEQFERRVFSTLGDVAAASVRKADVLAILDGVKAEGKLRTCNVLLADLKQMFRFAVERDIIPHSPIEVVKKRQAGGADTERNRVLTPDDIKTLATNLGMAGLSKRSERAIAIILATGCRIGELMSAQWQHVDTLGCTWHLPDTKNQRTHTIHLSEFAVVQFNALADLRQRNNAGDLVPWVFPNAQCTGPVNVKSFGKQLADRQRPPDKRLKNRSTATSSLVLPGGKWTAHDLRRTAATLMASLKVPSDVIDECLNHMIQSRVTRVYIRDRREVEQAQAFDLLGAKLEQIVSSMTTAGDVPDSRVPVRVVPRRKTILIESDPSPP